MMHILKRIYRHLTSGNIVWKKSFNGIVTVERQHNAQALVIKRNNRTLSGIFTETKEPSSRLYWFPHLTELLPNPPYKILSIGGGACAYPIYAMLKNKRLAIDVVEQNPVVIEAAKRFFPLPYDSKFHMYLDDGMRYIHKARRRQYEFVFVDVGIQVMTMHPQVNTQFVGGRAAKQYDRVLGKKGYLMINIITTRTKRDTKLVSEVIEPIANRFACQYAFKVTTSANTSHIQDVVYLFCKEHITFLQLQKRLKHIAKGSLTHPKKRYRWMLKSLVNSK